MQNNIKIKNNKGITYFMPHPFRPNKPKKNLHIDGPLTPKRIREEIAKENAKKREKRRKEGKKHPDQLDLF